MRYPVRLLNRPCLADHTIEGRAVYPAVESLERLAEAVAAHSPGHQVLSSRDAEFLRFLSIEPDQEGFDALADIALGDDGSLKASLGAIVHTPGGSLSRFREYARVSFSEISLPVPLSLDRACAGEGVCFAVPAERLYEELVPFGPSFQNAVGTVYLFNEGAVAGLQSPDFGTPGRLLGSPYVLDAAFHVACAWGQRYHGFIAFPVGYAARKIMYPAEAGAQYWCRVVPAGAQDVHTLLFDILIYDAAGRLCERADGVRMKNIFQDRLQVPSWIRTDITDEFSVIRNEVPAMSVVELASILPFSGRVLTGHERAVGQKRFPGKTNRFVGARIALKRLVRLLSAAAVPDDPSLIETVAADNIHPACPVDGGRQPLYCSAAHDDRFAVAVGSDRPVGVDVERIRDVLMKGAHIFMTPAERSLCAQSPLGEKQAALRVWTTKECAVKVSGMSLPAAWSGVELKKISFDRSTVSIRGKMSEAVHAPVGDHLFTVLNVSEG